MPLNSFYEAIITLLPKPDRYHKKVQANISYGYECKNPQKALSELNIVVYKKNYMP